MGPLAPKGFLHSGSVRSHGWTLPHPPSSPPDQLYDAHPVIEIVNPDDIRVEPGRLEVGRATMVRYDADDG